MGLRALSPVLRELQLGFKYCATSLVGFVTDAVLLQIGLYVGMEPAWARLVSLACAMQATFLINGRHVFGGLDRTRWPQQWLGYMATNGFGNFCNYWIFVTLVSLHMKLVSEPLFALAVGAVSAWAINYAATRFLVFRKPRGPALTTPPPADAPLALPGPTGPAKPPR